MSLITALFSAGPGMIIAMPLAEALIAESSLPRNPMFVAVALAVCAGSCLTLFSATSGPLLQTGVAQARLAADEGDAVDVSLLTYLGMGAGSYLLILGGAFTYATWWV